MGCILSSVLCIFASPQLQHSENRVMHNPCSIDLFRVEGCPTTRFAPPVFLGKLGRSRIGATILILDGDPLFRHYLKSSLQEARYVVHVAANGQEALAILTKVAIDLVVVDAKLIQTTDFMLCSALRAAREVPILVIASSRSPAAASSATSSHSSTRWFRWPRRPFSKGTMRGRREFLARGTP